MDLSNVTVLIPAHNRPERLRRLLAYYSRTNIKILVADSSTLQFPFPEDFPSITYRHQPGMEFLRKVNEVLPLIHTEYVFFCADDDFIVPETVKRITVFLEDNPDYCTMQGHYLTFEVHKNNIEFYPRYIRNFTKEMDGETGRKRLNQYNNLYASMLYSVCRSDLFKEMYSALMDDATGNPRFTNLYAAEEYYNMYTLIHGNHYTSQNFYSARERIKGSAASITVPFDTFITAARYKDEYDAFIDILSNKLSVTDKIPLEEARRFILTMMEKRLADKLSFKQRILAFVDKYAATQWISNLLYERYKTKGREMVRNMDSYPITTDTPEKRAIIESIRNMK